MSVFKSSEPEEIENLKKWLPTLIHENSIISIEIDKYHDRPDIRDEAIIFSGNKEGFMSLRDVFNYCANEFLDAKLDITILPFVHHKLKKRFILEFYDDERDIQLEIKTDIDSDFGITIEDSNSITWLISWLESAQVIQLIHGFLYDSWDHLHFDPKNEISKYAVVFYLNNN